MTSSLPPQSGFLLINKPAGPTTYDMIRWLKRKVKKVKIGHCGTLDPFATGLVILLLGKATKQQSMYMGQNKTYRCRLKFGTKTDTGDCTGEPVKTTTIPPLSKAQIEEVLKGFCGEQEQIPPMYSALKHKGKPLYKLARKGETVERKPRQISIDSLDLLEWDGQSELEVRTRVSSGTYIRTLVEDIGEKLGSCATTLTLCREEIGEIHYRKAMNGEELKNLTDQEIWTKVESSL